MGGFGGCVHEICQLILGEGSRYLQLDWQKDYNLGYESLQIELEKLGKLPEKLDSIVEKIKKINIQDLANNARLSKEEYLQLMTSPFSDECFYIINKGLKIIKKDLKC